MSFLHHEFRFFSGLIPSCLRHDQDLVFGVFVKRKTNSHSSLQVLEEIYHIHCAAGASVAALSPNEKHSSLIDHVGLFPAAAHSFFPGESPASHFVQHVRKQVGKAQSQRKSLIFPMKIGKDTQDHTCPALIPSCAAGFIFNLTNTSQANVSLL